MSRKTWENNSSKPHKGDSNYGLNLNKTAISFMATHDLHPTPDAPNRDSVIFLTFGTFDAQFVLLQDEYLAGKFNGNHLSMKERLRLKTTYPIANCRLENRYNSTNNRDEVIGYLVDIFSNVYSVNFTFYINLNSRSSTLQPIAYNKVYDNIPKALTMNTIHEEYPLLFHKHGNKVILFNLAGELKLLDFDQAQSKSWINNSVLPQFEYSFGIKGLAACCNTTNSSLGSVVVIAAKNNQVPYVFVNTDSLKYIQNSRRCIDKYVNEWQQPTQEITFCSFDATTNLLAVSLITSEIELYEIKKSTQTGQTFHYCQKVLKFFPTGSRSEPKRYIEYLSASQGFLAITLYDEYVVMDLRSKVVKKRGKGNKDKNRVEKLKWTHIIDRENDCLAVALSKGFNHHTSQQSRIGKPNLHFKTIDLKKESRDK